MKKVVVINLCPHPINLVDGRVIPSMVPGNADAERIANAPKLVAKDPTSTEEDFMLEDGTVLHVWHDPNPTEIVGLPEPKEGVIYAVSMPVATKAAEQGRTDVYSPGSRKPGATKEGTPKVPGLVNFH